LISEESTGTFVRSRQTFLNSLGGALTEKKKIRSAHRASLDANANRKTK